MALPCGRSAAIREVFSASPSPVPASSSDASGHTVICSFPIHSVDCFEILLTGGFERSHLWNSGAVPEDINGLLGNDLAEHPFSVLADRNITQVRPGAAVRGADICRHSL